MSKIKRALENNEILVACLKQALKQGHVTVNEIKQTEKKLKRDFPHMKYDFSSLYNEETKNPVDVEEVEDDEDVEDDDNE